MKLIVSLQWNWHNQDTIILTKDRDLSQQKSRTNEVFWVARYPAGIFWTDKVHTANPKLSIQLRSFLLMPKNFKVQQPFTGFSGHSTQSCKCTDSWVFTPIQSFWALKITPPFLFYGEHECANILKGALFVGGI